MWVSGHEARVTLLYTGGGGGGGAWDVGIVKRPQVVSRPQRARDKVPMSTGELKTPRRHSQPEDNLVTATGKAIPRSRDQEFLCFTLSFDHS